MLQWSLSNGPRGALLILLIAVPTAIGFALRSKSGGARSSLSREAKHEGDGSDTAGTVDLQMPFGAAPTAKDIFHQLASAAEELGVDFQDVYGADKPESSGFLSSFEGEVATMLGKEAAVFIPSGTMAQQIVLCLAQSVKNGIATTLPQRRRAFLAHPTSHLLLHEQQAHQHLLNVPVCASGDKIKPLTSRDIELNLDAATDAAFGSAPAAVILEVPHRELGGDMTPLEEIRDMSKLCSQQNVWFHMDGARLFEAAPYFQTTHGVDMPELCSYFRTVYVRPSSSRARGPCP